MALRPGALDTGVVEKIAALASRDHGDARQAVALLARSAQQAERTSSQVTLATVDQAAEQIEQDRYIMMIRTAPRQLQAVLAGAIRAWREQQGPGVTTGEVYRAYRTFCERATLKPLAGRAFGELLTELDMYAFLQARLESRGRYGRTREISFDLDEDLLSKIQNTILINFDLQGQTTEQHGR